MRPTLRPSAPFIHLGLFEMMHDNDHDTDNGAEAVGLAIVLTVQGIAWLTIGLAAGWLLWGKA